MKSYYGLDIKAKREELLKSSVAKPMIEKVIKLADEALNAEYHTLKISDFMLFIETGDRFIYQKEYNKITDNCMYMGLAFWLTEDEKYKKPLVDLIFHVCDVYTWCLPAHAKLADNPTSEDVIEQIDLVQSEVAKLLTDITVMVGDKLPYYAKDRIKYEIRRRIIKPMREKKFFWWYQPTTINNWAAVCASGTGIAVLHFGTDEEKESILPVLTESMHHFLSGYNDDGCCLEGPGYWNYGFSRFLAYAMAILDYSDGKINLFDSEKVKQIALFPQRARLGKTKIASFSDGEADYSFYIGVISLLRKIYKDEVSYPSMEFMADNFQITDFLWLDCDYREDEKMSGTTFFEGAQWYVKQGENYSFAAKAGFNAEHHNHNDVGSFMIVTNDNSMPLADIGRGVYTRQNFAKETRYTIINNGSHGHSVPIINGEYQQFGQEFRSCNVIAGEDYFEADIEGAYEKGLVKKIHRRFELKDSSVILRDTFEYSDKTESITERMISWTKPEVTDGCVDLNSVVILFDTKKYTVSVTEDSYTKYKGIDNTSVFLIDFKGNDARETKFEFDIKIKKHLQY